jgi:hypothetical protein
MIEEEFIKGIIKLLNDAGIQLPSKAEIEKRIAEILEAGLTPEAKETPKEIIENHGLAFEEHKIHTEDHYILTAFRIYNKTNCNHRPIIL